MLQPASELLHIHLCFAARGKQLVFFVLDVMLDLFPEHLDTRVIEAVGSLRGTDLGDQLLGARVLDGGFVQQCRVDTGLASCRIEDFFFDDGVHGEHSADPSGQRSAIACVSLALGEQLVVLEQRFDLVVVLLQQVDGVDIVIGIRRSDGCDDLFQKRHGYLR